MSARIWSSLQRKSSHGKSGWQLVGRGEAADAPKKDGREVRPLSYKEIAEMNSEDAAWHLRNNTEAWNAAFDEELRRRQSKIHVAKTRVELCWQGNSTEQEDEAARRAGESFAISTPAFPRTLEAATLVADFMKQNLMDATRVESYRQAFDALVRDEKIKPLSYQSADEFLKNNPQLIDQRKPPLIQAKEAKARATANFAAKTEAASAKAGSTTVTDYPHEQRGVPPLNEIEKASLRQKVRSMTADELAEKCQTDPSFKKALDSLAVGLPL